MVLREESDSHRSGPQMFILLVIGTTWVFWMPAALLPDSLAAVRVVLHYAGGLGPSIAAAIVLFGNHTRAARIGFLRRMVPRGRWAILGSISILLCTGILNALSIFLAYWAYGAPDPAVGLSYFLRPLDLLTLALFVFFFGPVTEEIGWRGYLLPALQHHLNPFVSSIVVGVVWAVWHLPLFVIPGTYQQSLGILSVAFATFVANILVLSFIMTWISKLSSGNIFAAVFFHFATNLWGNVFGISKASDVIRVTLFAVVAGVIVVSERKYFFGRGVASIGGEPDMSPPPTRLNT